MKYFNFVDYEYYALIGATNVEEAISYYKKTVGELELEDKDKVPEEISKDEAKKLFVDASIHAGNSDAETEFNNLCNANEPILFLIDGSLL